MMPAAEVGYATVDKEVKAEEFYKLDFA